MASAVPPLEEWASRFVTCYDNPVNSFETEPVQYIAPYARDPATNHHRLYICNFPPELDEDGLEDIFKRYGTPLGIYIRSDKTYAFVSYATIREGQLAIQKLNDQPPLHMKVKFGKDNEKPPKKQFQHQIPQPPHNPHIQSREYIAEETYHPQSRFRNIGRGRDLSNLAATGLGPRQPCAYDSNADVLYPAIRDPTYFDPFEDEGPHRETNNMYARSVRVTNDGNRYVSMGRGYTFFELPPPHPNIDEQIKSVYGKRRSGLYEYGENKLSDQIGKCRKCAAPATHRCKRCREFYCNRTCQTMDWITHKYECVPMPELEAVDDLSSMSLSSNEERAQPTSQPEKPAQLRRPLRNQSPMRRKVNSTPHLTLPQRSAADFNSAVPHKSFDNPLEEPDGPKIDGPQIDGPNIEDPKIDGPIIDHLASKIDPVLPRTDVRVNHSYQNNTTSTDQNRDTKTGSTTPMQNRLDNARHPHGQFKSSSPIEDRPQINQNRQPDFQGPRPNRFNHRVNHNPNQTGFNGYRNEARSMQSNNRCETNSSTSTPPKQPPFDNNHNNRNNQNINVNFPAQSPRTENQPAQNGANDKNQGNDKSQDNRIRNQGRTSNCNDKVTVRPSIQLQDPQLDFQRTKLPTNNVRTQLPNRSSTPDPLGPITSSSSSKNSETPTDATVQTKSDDPISVVESLAAEDKGCFEVHVPLGNNKFAITICTYKIYASFSKLMSKLTKDCQKLPKDPNLKPNVGDLICGRRGDDWIRGNVMSVGPPIQLSVIDEGRIEAVDDIRAIPQEYISMPILGATCEVIGEELKLQLMQRYDFNVVRIRSADNKCVEVYVKADGMEGRVILSSWSPAPEQKRLKLATLTSGTEVLLTSFVNQNLLYVRSLVPKDSETFHRLIQDVAKFAIHASPVTQPPVDGQLVLCKFSQDDNFYRGIVRHITDEKFRVTYVDFGNSEETTIANMRHMPDQLKEYPSSVAKIVLTGVPIDVPMTEEAYSFLSSLAGTEKRLTCVFNGTTLKDGVTLKTAEGINVNEKVIELLKPSWKKNEPEDKTVYTIDMLDVAELGPVGKSVQVIPLAKQGDGLYVMAPQDPELCSHIQGVMSEQIQEYCTQTKEHYIPREDELCLAPFEGVWYRATCMQPNISPSASQVMFVDYGNTENVAHKDIRVITKDFLTTKALGSICLITGLDDSNPGQMSPSVNARLEELVPLMSLVTIKISQNIGPGSYIIELPDVHATLVKEGLIKPQ